MVNCQWIGMFLRFHNLQKRRHLFVQNWLLHTVFPPYNHLFPMFFDAAFFHILITLKYLGSQMVLPPGSDALRVWNGFTVDLGQAARGTATRGGGIHEAARKGNLPGLRHFLHADPGSVGEKTRHGRSLKISSIASGCRFGARNPTFWSLVLTCVNRNLDSCSMLVYCIFGLELADLLQRSEGNHSDSDGTCWKHDKTWQYKWTLQERCNVTTAFLDTVHLWTLEKLNLVSDHVIT